jgi:hypothetical protein
MTQPSSDKPMSDWFQDEEMRWSSEPAQPSSDKLTAWLQHKAHCLAQQDLHGDTVCRCGLEAALQSELSVTETIADYLDQCAKEAVNSGSDFNQGVVRGLEIAAAQVRNGHALSPKAPEIG